ncbi:M20 metallopeptidase family protein [Thermoflavimicrobium daqui]|uniref:M20 metallopeptidase family protein n=1 Tax=Thermoflavimicrobium daqui TaxID=2137476 RepID=UPI001F0CB3BC|nr:M20 family metallopeptidase [Thermoflavimicrobium daqui]
MKLSKEHLWKQVEEIYLWLVEMRRNFHAEPEFGMEEFLTRQKIISKLEEMDIPYECVANTGVVGIIRGAKEGKTVALRADMDALPIHEENDLSYQSKFPGKMHACGHDAHMTILLGAAKLLQEYRHFFSGNVKLFFQPAEETVGGAKPMIEEGVLENPKVDAIFGVHVAPHIPVGQIAVKYGQMYASSDTIHIQIVGENGHGAYPHTGKDAIVIAAQVIQSLQTIVSRNVDPRQSAVLSIGVIQGGTQANIIANKVELTGTVRTLNQQIRKTVLQRIEEMVSLVARSMGGESNLRVVEGYCSLHNDKDMVDLVKQTGQFLLGEHQVQVEELPSLGVEDFAFFLKDVPGAFYRIGCRNEEMGCVYDLHHPRFNLDEKCLKIGTAMQVANALRFLGVSIQ